MPERSIVTFLRDALIEAVYRSEVEKLAAAAWLFAVEMPPIEVVRAWMLPFVDHLAAKLIIAQALNSVVGGASKLLRGIPRPGGWLRLKNVPDANLLIVRISAVAP